MSEPRFIADVMLGRLARYLRFLGYDTLYHSATKDEELVARSRDQQRILLTCDARLVAERRPEQALLIEVAEPLEQLRVVVEHFSLRHSQPRLIRCTLCNGLLVEAPQDMVEARAPRLVQERYESFAYCEPCGRVYWEGSHMERLRRRFARVLGPGSGLDFGGACD